MPQIANPRKVFNFIIEVDGLNAFEAQKVTLPTLTVAKTEHGDTNYAVKTPGRYSIEDLVIEKLRPMPGADNWAYNWLIQAQNPLTGGGALPSDIKKTVVVREMDSTGLVALNSHIYEGCWPTSIEFADMDRNSDDNMIETVTLSVDRGRQI